MNYLFFIFQKLAQRDSFFDPGTPFLFHEAYILLYMAEFFAKIKALPLNPARISLKDE
jgi:hypothetical protein